MKKLFIAALIFALLSLSSPAMSEENSSWIEGEWYVSVQYTLRCSSATLDNDNRFHVNWRETEIVYAPDGSITNMSNPEDITYASYSVLQDGSCLYYMIEGHDFYGYLFCKMAGEWKCYLISQGNLELFADGEVIPYVNGSGDRTNYIVVHDRLFIMNEDSYMRGDIVWFDELAFAYYIDTDHYIANYGGDVGEVDYGTPFYLFIRSDISA